MKQTLADYARPSGTIDRRTYALIGFLGFAIKYNIDRVIAAYMFQRQWSLFSYWVPIRDLARISDLSRKDALFIETMIATALPFIWLGVTLTLKRLRSAGWPTSLVLLFFAPFLNVVFLLALCIVPEREAAPAEDQLVSPSRKSTLRFIPQGALGSAVAAVVVTVPIALGLIYFGTHVMLNYGWGIFVALPFTMGFTAALIYGVHQPRTLRGCVGVACLTVVVFGAALLALVVEGVICLAMALPLGLPLAAIGGAFGYTVQRHRWFPKSSPAFLSALLLFVPGVQGIEHVASPHPPVFVVRSSIDIQAPPEEVWKEVVAFTQIGPPNEWIFRAGIAYPIRAEIYGTGPGAERHCVFSTGAFVEPIQIWDEPRQLKFSVTSNPPPMQEWTLYSHVEPPHLHGYLVSEGGQFLLAPLPNGGTRLEGTTWYQHGLWPAQYWRLWSDAVIHRIHMRVLRHIRDEAERKAS
jgi:hypothetical protein